MPLATDTLDARLAELDRLAAALRLPAGAPVAIALDRVLGDVAAARFHLRAARDWPPLVAVLGGTGTGKSTLVNRLLGATVSATSFRRTFTAGVVAVARDAGAVPAGWLGVDRRDVPAGAPPVRGEAGSLAVAIAPDADLTAALTLVDTPDLDGDAPAHHAEADRAFRWAEAVLFLVTPEKYQMTELLPYYRLAQRYAVPALFAMNKCEEQVVLDDFRAQLADRGWAGAPSFVIPRDDAAYEPPPEADLAALGRALPALAQRTRDVTPAARAPALARRAADAVGRARDHVIAPLRRDRRDIDRLVPLLRTLERPAPGVDVSPLTQQLQRRLQEQSVLYLMGPGRVMQRVRQVPGMLLRLPRTLWDVVTRGEVHVNLPAMQAGASSVPDFRAILADQMTIAQSRVDDMVRSTESGDAWLGGGERVEGGGSTAASYKTVKIDPARAAAIAEEEIAALRDWLSRRWHGTPRDTLLLQRLLKFLPGGKKLTAWSEAAPYLLAVVVATHHVFFGPIDLMIIGGFSLATWLGEKLSNEVTNRTRQTNRRIAERFEELVREQIDAVCTWLESQAPSQADIDRLERAADAVSEGAGQ